MTIRKKSDTNLKSEKKLISNCDYGACRHNNSQFSYEKKVEEWEETKNGRIVKHNKETYFELWGEKVITQVDIFRMEEEAAKYVGELYDGLKIVPPGQKKAQGAKKGWQEGAVEYLKKRPLIFVISVLENWKEISKVDWASQFVDFALVELQNYLLKLYESEEVSEREKQVFKKKIAQKFSKSLLAAELEKLEKVREI